jgi:hypothetical protein
MADLADDPAACAALDPARTGRSWVVICRYADARWLKALRAARGRLAGVALMLDDDMPAMVGDPALPGSYRRHVLFRHLAHAPGLERTVSEIWASTPVLADLYGARVILDPLPEADPPEPPAGPPRLAVYHAGASHRAERRFVLAVAALAPSVAFEVAGPPEPAPGNVTFVPERTWPAYRDAQRGRSAMVALAPLLPSRVNAARAPVKAFDAARLGAAGLYAGVEPYRGFVRDGVDGRLLPMRPEAWAEAILALVDDPAAGRALAGAARERLLALRRTASPFPGAAGA